MLWVTEMAKLTLPQIGFPPVTGQWLEGVSVGVGMFVLVG